MLTTTCLSCLIPFIYLMISNIFLTSNYLAEQRNCHYFLSYKKCIPLWGKSKSMLFFFTMFLRLLSNWVVYWHLLKFNTYQILKTQLSLDQFIFFDQMKYQSFEVWIKEKLLCFMLQTVQLISWQITE